MGKQVLIVSGSPRKDGNSELLCAQFQRGAEENGHEVEFVSLRDKTLHYCLGCELCQENGGTCIHRDDVPALLEKLLACDVLVLATPVYYYGFTAQMKTFLDRTFAKVGAIQNKDAYLLAAGASPEHSDMDALVAAYHGFLRCFSNVNDKGIVYGVGAMGRGTVGKAALAEAYRLGMNI